MKLFKVVLGLALLVAVRAQDEDAGEESQESKDAAEAKEPKEPKAPAGPSKLAPTVRYLGLHSFLHGGHGSADKTPKVLLLLDGKEAELPDWYTSVAMSFKEGKKKSVSFAVVKEDGAKAALRFGVPKDEEVPKAGILVVAVLDGKGAGRYARFTGSELRAGGGAAVRAVKEFVRSVVDENTEAALLPLPSFPPPDIPRKQASTSLVELTYDNLPTHCFGGAKAICLIALMPAGASKCPAAVAELAKRHRNDNVQFAWLKAQKQQDFVQGFGIEMSQLPMMVAVKVGKRNRFAKLEGDLAISPMGGFVDRILGGDMTFAALKPLPELEPAYLQGGDDEEEPAAAATGGGDEGFEDEDKVEL